MKTPARFGGTEQLLHDAARAATGLSDFGPADSYMPGLTRILDTADRNGPRFTDERGREFLWNTLQGVLIARLLAVQGWKDNPDCLSQPVRRPMIIIGIPRTGTTALHKLLSMDPQFQGMERWLTAFPMKRPPADSWNHNPWYQACAAGLDALFSQAPEMRAAHDMRPDDVDECLEVLKHGFVSNFFGSTFRLPEYDRWWRQQSEAPAYQWLVKVMQLIGADHPDKTWLLKNPGHVAEVDVLLDTFPDACIVQTHRHPARAIPSLCSTLHQARAISEGDKVDPLEIGERELRYWSNAVESADRARQRAPAQFIDVYQSELHRDPMAVISQIYHHFGLQLSAEAERNMRQRIAHQPEAQHGEHVYTAEQFGLNGTRIREAFAEYIERYGLLSGGLGAQDA